jgi:nitric oxide reductase NorD protein
VQAFSAAELNQRLEALLNPVLSSRRTARPLAEALAPLTREQHNFTLRWVEIIARTNYEMAYQFAAAAPSALATLDAANAEAWIIHAMDTYDRAGLYQGGEAFKNVAAFTLSAAEKHAVRFEEAAPVLAHFVCGLAGRRLEIEAAPAAWTDTATLYLPLRMAAGTSREQNFLIYKIIATLLWAQSRFGTFSADLQAATRQYAEPARALDWLNYLESVRLEARIAHVLPGLARDLNQLRGGARESKESQFTLLQKIDATVADSIALLDTLPLDRDAPRDAWTGALRPAEAAAKRAARLAQEKDELQAALAALLAEEAKRNTEDSAGSTAGEGETFDVETRSNETGELEHEISLGGKPVAAPDHVRKLLDSIAQDLGEIPDDYLTPRADDATNDDADIEEIPPEEHPRFYDEWDYQRRHYRKQWCALRELDVPSDNNDFARETLHKYAPQVLQLRRSFEMLRGEDRLMKRMIHGDDIDLDAVIAGYADLRAGSELTERLFTRRHKAERNLAVMFMVDMSGSTKGWINEAERESLVLLAEALEVLGDRYAIYGFSGMTRKRCEIFRIKRFDEAYSSEVRSRIAGITPQDYTRMGAAIRHLSALLDEVDARTKLLITLSDGKPDDYSDNYRGDYGIEDTRQALLESHRMGIKPFCITIDHEARAYLPHMYGAANWTLVDDVSRLPLKVTDIYRRLTT